MSTTSYQKSSMNFSIKIFFALTMIVASLLSDSVFAAKDPKTVIQTAATEMTTELTKNKQRIQEDPLYVEQLVDRILLPVVDDEYMSKLVLAKYWRKTSQSQKQMFTQAFKRKIVATYAGAFKAFNGESISYSKAKFNKTKTKASVASKILRRGAPPIKVTYKLYLSKKKKVWLGYDVVIEGISIVKSFRDQFKQQIQSQGLAQAIAALNKEFPSLTPTVTIAANVEEPYISKTKPGKGLAMDVITQILKRAGYEVNIVFMPWKRIENGFSDNSIDISPIDKFLDPEKTPFLTSDVYMNSELVVVKRKEDMLNFKTPREFKNYIQDKAYRMGVFSEIENPVFNDLRPHVSLSFHDYCSELTRDVAQKKVDIALIDRRIATNNLSRTPNIADHLTILPTTLISQEIRLSINDQREDAQQIKTNFDKALKEMKADGSYAKIIKRHDTLAIDNH